MQAHEAQEAADVALLLRLRPDQQAGYQAWRASMEPSESVAEPGGGWRRGDKAPEASGPQNTPQELERMQAMMAERTTRERARLDATRRFYASLGPEQQTLFDALMRLRLGGGGRYGIHRELHSEGPPRGA